MPYPSIPDEALDMWLVGSSSREITIALNIRYKRNYTSGAILRKVCDARAAGDVRAVYRKDPSPRRKRSYA